MARWAPEAVDTYAALADEIVTQAGVARTVIGVDGTDPASLERVADGLVRALAARGVPAEAAAAPSSDVDELRADLVAPFRTTGESDGVLVVYGPGLVAVGTRALWRWSLWVEREDTALDRRADVKVAASAVLDVTDPEHPRRDWNDAC